MEQQEDFYKVKEITRIIINECLKRKYDIDEVKLHQLLTLMQGTMLAKYDKILFSQDIINCDTTVIKEIFQNVMSREINLKNNTKGYTFSDEENAVIDEIISRFGIYNAFVLKTAYVLDILDVIHSEKGSTIPTEYLKKIFLEFGFGVTEDYNSNTNDKRISNGTFINFAEKYSYLISDDFPRKWRPNPETGYLPPDYDLGQLVGTIAENGFVENYCLDEHLTKQLKLIRYYKNNYNQKD